MFVGVGGGRVGAGICTVQNFGPVCIIKPKMNHR